MEKRSLRSFQATEAPHSVDHTIREKFLDRSNRREVCPNLVEEILEGVGILFWENNVTRKESVSDSIETDASYPFRCLWSRGMASVSAISGLLSLARHLF